jgi:hypothetical protein
MNTATSLSDRAVGNELRRVVEPLVNYICATEQPNSALWSALSVLFREVEATNGVAALHFRSLLASRCPQRV